MEEQTQTQVQAQTSPSAQCPVCASPQLRKMIDLPQLPVLANVLWDSRKEAASAPRADVCLSFCENCGHVFNREFDPARLAYDVQYENSLHFSPRFQQYAHGLARYLVNQYDLHGKSIVEIGSGKGEFLRLLCEYGGNVGTGFDPSYSPTPAEAHPAISFIKDNYSERYANHQADLIVSRHVLEHIYRPAEFVSSLRRLIGSRRRTAVFFEVPNLAYILRDTAVWDVIYEHYSYFSGSSLSDLFTRSGFNVLNMATAYEDQFLYLEAIPRDMNFSPPNTASPQPVAALARQVDGFVQRSQEKLAYWQEQLNRLRSQGKRAVVWGAGSKGISFLNMLDAQDEIAAVVDINPRKQGKFITGAGLPIVPPEQLSEIQPDALIVMNPIYRAEVEQAAQQLGLRVDFLFAS